MTVVSRREFMTQISAAALGSIVTGGCGLKSARSESMSGTFQIRGIEKQEYKDSQTGRTVLQLTNSPMESKHAYYDICPWCPDQKYIAFSSADLKDLTSPHKDLLTTQHGQVCIMDTETSEIRVIGEDGYYTTHNGTFPVWHPLKNTLYYRRAREEIVAVDVQTGRRSVMEGVLRQLSPDGKKFASQLNRSDRPDDPDAWGFYTMNEDGSDLRRILSIDQVYEATQNKDEFTIDQMTVGNPKWHPDNQHLLITMWVQKRGVRRSLYITKKDGSDLRWLTYFGHHHSWSPDGKRVLFNDSITVDPESGRRENRMHLIDFDGTNRTIVIDEPLGSHPLMDPTGTMIVDHDGQGVFLVHLHEQRVERLTTFRAGFDISHKGTHPHCVWNRDGTQVLYNSGETGHSEIYLLHIQV